MFAEIINTVITTSAWTEIKPSSSLASANIIIQAADDTEFKISLTGSDSDPFWTVKVGAAVSPGTLRLYASTTVIYAKSIEAGCTVQTIIKGI